MLRLQSYRYKVVYKPGKNNIADPLSRLVNFEPVNESFDEANEVYVNNITTLAVPVAINLEEIKSCSKSDESIQAVHDALHTGNWSELAKPFKPFELELCFAGEILLRGTKIIMPECLRERTLVLAHEGHPGISKMKQRLRTKVWWPKIDSEAEAFVKKCHGCLMVTAPPPPEPIRRTILPEKKWQHVAIDYLGPLPSNDYLFVVVRTNRDKLPAIDQPIGIERDDEVRDRDKQRKEKGKEYADEHRHAKPSGTHVLVWLFLFAILNLLFSSFSQHVNRTLTSPSKQRSLKRSSVQNVCVCHQPAIQTRKSQPQ